ncbi:Protein 60A [Eumeta japonica]|uniref:Protein 60A n=1 Tax=Eumeta variegata TaxID=151549 RepID=A0A4C1ZV59_EUMVA|nr:Protein 60A [Eumeta japonica]
MNAWLDCKRDCGRPRSALRHSTYAATELRLPVDFYVDVLRHDKYQKLAKSLSDDAHCRVPKPLLQRNAPQTKKLHEVRCGAGRAQPTLSGQVLSAARRPRPPAAGYRSVVCGMEGTAVVSVGAVRCALRWCVLAVLVGAAQALLSGLYIDNGVDQTVIHHAMTRNERLVVEHEILELLGLGARPRRARARALDRSAPSFLLDVYKQLAEEHEQARPTRSSELALGGDEQQAIDESDLIMTFQTKRHLDEAGTLFTRSLGPAELCGADSRGSRGRTCSRRGPRPGTRLHANGSFGIGSSYGSRITRIPHGATVIEDYQPIAGKSYKNTALISAYSLMKPLKEYETATTNSFRDCIEALDFNEVRTAQRTNLCRCEINHRKCRIGSKYESGGEGGRGCASHHSQAIQSGHHLGALRHGHGQHLWFEASGAPDAASLLTAELRLHQAPVRTRVLSSPPNELYTVAAHRVLSVDSVGIHSFYLPSPAAGTLTARGLVVGVREAFDKLHIYS